MRAARRLAARNLWLGALRPFGAGSTSKGSAGPGWRVQTTLAADHDARERGYVGWSFTAPPTTTIGSYTLWRTVRPAHGGAPFNASLGPRLPSVGGRARPLGLRLQRRGVCRGVRRTLYRRGDPSRLTPMRTGSTDQNVELKRLFATMECVGQTPSCPALAAPGQLRSMQRASGCPIPGAVSPAPRPGPCLERRADRRRAFARLYGAGRGRRDRACRIVATATPAVSRARHRDPPCAFAPIRSRAVPRKRRGDARARHCALPNGAHAIQASVIDAAGNETRSDPVTVTTRNGSQPMAAVRAASSSSARGSARGARPLSGPRRPVRLGAVRRGPADRCRGAPIAGAVPMSGGAWSAREPPTRTPGR